jgi:hypothetical protein
MKSSISRQHLFVSHGLGGGFLYEMRRDNFAVGIALVLDPPAHRQRVRGLIADIEEELRDLGDKTNSEAER